jgi:hypothetical protein
MVEDQPLIEEPVASVAEPVNADDEQVVQDYFDNQNEYVISLFVNHFVFVFRAISVTPSQVSNASYLSKLET